MFYQKDIGHYWVFPGNRQHPASARDAPGHRQLPKPLGSQEMRPVTLATLAWAGLGVNFKRRGIWSNCVAKYGFIRELGTPDSSIELTISEIPPFSDTRGWIYFAIYRALSSFSKHGDFLKWGHPQLSSIFLGCSLTKTINVWYHFQETPHFRGDFSWIVGNFLQTYHDRGVYS